MIKHSKGGYGQKCQTFQSKFKIAHENTQSCQDSEYK